MDDESGETYFLGSKKSMIRYNKESEEWNLTTDGKSSMFITSRGQVQSLVLGQRQWNSYNEPKCSQFSSYNLQMALTPCKENQFNCRNGTCIDMEQRCNQRKDCTDGSDEMECRIIVLEKGYQKEKPAPPIDQISEKNSVNINMKLESVQRISETQGSITLLFHMEMQWWDPRLNFENLKKTTELNILTRKESEKIWVPVLVFNNTQNKLETSNDKKTVVFVTRDGDFINSDITTLDNVEVFAGTENMISMGRMYNMNFMCEYHLDMYPFDTQTCYMTLVLDIRIHLFVKMDGGFFDYNGPTDLPKYFVKNTTMELSGESLQMKIVLGRKLMNQILTTFLPTGLLIIIIHSTNYFKDFFFEAVVSVNLTGMLVLTTIFLSVSSTLPETAYVKMIDVWLLFCILVPFFEVLLHIWMDTLRMDENRQVNNHGQPRSAGIKKGLVKVQPLDKNLVHRNEQIQVNALKEWYGEAQKNEKYLKVGSFIGRKLIPGTILIFVTCFWCIGLMHYNG